jgi:predicted Zn-dependent peptidase
MLFRGTARYGSEEIDQIFDSLGAEANAGTDKEATSLYTRVLDVHLERALDVMSDMVWAPRFGELEAEREVVLEEIAMYEDDPQDRAFDLLASAVYGSHPLGRPVIGTADVIRAVTVERLAGFHAARYRPTEIVVAAAGSLDHDRIVELVLAAQDRALAETPAFAGPAGESNGAGDAAVSAVHAAQGIAATPPEFRPRTLFLEKDTEQYHVCLGAPGIARDDERRFALRVLEGVLGGTSSSRLFQEVRERRGLAYSVFTFSNLFAGSGEVGIYVGTRPENVGRALEVVADELARVRENPAAEDELVRSRENLKGRMALGLESTGSRMTRLGASLLAGLPLLSVEELIARIDAVSLEDVRELAYELFDPSRISFAGVGPDERRFHEAIEPFPVAAAAATDGSGR